MAARQYDRVPLYEDHEKLLEGEPQTASDVQDKQPKRQRWWMMVPVSWLLNVAMGVAVAALSIKLSSRPPYDLTGDINGIAPHFPQRVVTFQPDKASIANITDANFHASTKDYWLSLVPTGLGFLHIPDYEQYADLKPPYHINNKPVYSTSVTHQLHCLYMVMRSYNSLIVDGYKPPAEGEQDPHWHIAHCFDYIRQGIMCSGDTALEGEQTTFPEGKRGTDGWGVKHVCKDYRAVYSWLEEMRVDNRTWI